MTPGEAIEAGRTILDPLLAPAGFRWESLGEGRGSGGPFAQAAYVKGDLRLEFSYRWALGDVRYQVGGASIEHASLMRMLGAYRSAKFLSFDRADPLAGFVALYDDLVAYCDDFVHGQGSIVRRLAAELQALGGSLPSTLP